MSIVVVMFLWALCFPLIVLGLEDAPHILFAVLRAILAGVVLLAFAFVLKKAFPKNLRTWLLIFGVGLGATSLGFLGMFHAAEFISPGLATVIASTQPLLAAVLAHFVLHERLKIHAKIGLLIGFLGIVLITFPIFAGPGADFLLVGSSYIILAAIGITFSNVLIKLLGDEVDPLVSMGLQLVIGGLLLSVFVVVAEPQTAISWTPRFLISLIGLSVLGTALAYWLWCWVLTRVELSRANVFAFLVPIFGLTMGVMLYEESITILTFFGTGVTLAGITLVVRTTG